MNSITPGFGVYAFTNITLNDCPDVGKYGQFIENQ